MTNIFANTMVITVAKRNTTTVMMTVTTTVVIEVVKAVLIAMTKTKPRLSMQVGLPLAVFFAAKTERVWINALARLLVRFTIGIIASLTFGAIVGASTGMNASGLAQKALRCEQTLHEQQSEAVKQIVLTDAYAQWLLWETTANSAKFHNSTLKTAIPYRKIATGELNIQRNTSELDPKLLQLFDSSSTLWFEHPYNDSDQSAFANSEVEGSVFGHLTASRSIAFADSLKGYTVKLPTNRPHGPNQREQVGKMQIEDDLKSALVHSTHIQKRDLLLGADPSLIILPDIMTVATPDQKNGYIIRDVRALDDGHYYLPAFSIPFVGEQIAKINNRDFTDFWEEHFAAKLGEIKAKILLRYGMQMETPNGQNFLIQLDRNLRPTGALVVRDLSDVFFVMPIAGNLGFRKEMLADKQLGYNSNFFLRPYISNYFSFMIEDFRPEQRAHIINSWRTAHNNAYVSCILKELNTPLNTTLWRGRPLTLTELTEEDRYYHMENFHQLLLSEEFQLKIRDYGKSKGP